MKKLLYGIGVIVAILLLAMFFMGEKFHFEKAMVMNAPAEKIYQKISSMKEFNTWNPWMKLDPKMKIQYSGSSGQIGDTYCWDSKVEDAGAGCQEITGLVPGKMQTTSMTFSRPQPGFATSKILLESSGNATKVIWTLETEMEYPTNLMKPLMYYWMNESYTEGLENLKKLVEK